MAVPTGTFLDRIVARTAVDLELRKERQPLADLEQRAERQSPPIPLAAALRSGPVGVIAELKRASPSKGPILPDADADSVAGQYLAAGVSAISVLTDEPFFRGSLADLAAVAALAHADDLPRPVLRKDFLIDPYQVIEARAAGADAVLLIVALLPEPELTRMLTAVRASGMQALVEVHDERELDQALAAGAELVGINNRDLRTFQVDLTTTERLARLIPPGLTIVAESGIFTGADVRRLVAAGAHAVLVGESLMLAPDRAAALAELRS